MGSFEGLHVDPKGRIIAYLPAGVVRLEASDARKPGWYDWSWREVEDPTEVLDLDAALAKLDALMKVSKESVNYGPGHPGSRCGVCTHFERPDACAKVRGEIDEWSWCELFKRG